MIQHLFSVKDTAVNNFSNPLTAVNENVLRRSLAVGLRDKQLPKEWCEWPEQHSLWYLGSFNDENGVIDQQEPVFVCNLSELLKKPE